MLIGSIGQLDAGLAAFATLPHAVVGGNVGGQSGHGAYFGAMSTEPMELSGPAQWWGETGEYELRQILHWRWDPIGIASVFPYAADEYDNYASMVVDGLRAGASAAEIARLLVNIEDDRIFGRAPASAEEPVDRLRELGEAIVTWYETSQRRWTEFGPLAR